jgi:mono/diheme cytochrome c family protein
MGGPCLITVDRVVAFAALISFVGISAATWPGSSQPLSGDVAQGHALAIKVCSECHRVAKGQRASLISDAPAFQEIADASATTAMSLRIFLRTPHRNMPNLILAESETDDIIAYILSLK